MPRTNPDPRTKLILVFSLSGLAVFVNSPAGLTGILIICSTFALFLGCDWNFLRRLGKMWPILLGLLVVYSIFGSNAGQVYLKFGQFRLLTSEGVLRVFVLVMRLVIIAISGSILLRCSPRSLIQALIQWGIPYEIAFMVMLAIRFLPLLTEEMRDTLVAVQLRGIEVERLPLNRRIGLYSHLFFPVLVGVFVKAQRIATAMEMRAFRAFPVRTSHIVLAMGPRDYYFLTLLALSVLLIIGGLSFLGY